MVEMNAVSRFFVNALGQRRNRRRTSWIVTNRPVLPGAECLEVGCGNADMALRLCEALAPSRYEATDLDPKQTDAARRHLEQQRPAGLPRPLTLSESDMLHLPFPDRSFDAVFCFAALHHASASHHDFSSVPKALAEIDRVLRPGGRFVYEEFLHNEKVRAWLKSGGFSEVAQTRRFRTELVVVRKGP